MYKIIILKMSYLRIKTFASLSITMKMKNSLPWVLTVCTTLHIPAPAADTALTLTLYSVPASSPVRIIEVRGGDTEMVNSLLQIAALLFLYCTWYCEMGTSLCEVVQVTLRAGNPDLTALDRDTPVT